MKNSQEQLKPYLPNLVPKLYRYSFDPNPKISASMKGIFKAITDPAKATNEYFQEIMKEVLDSVTSKEWRTREGSCFALADLVQGRNWSEVKSFLYDMWYRSFRVLDDIKESVRKAATVSLKSISRLTTRLCDPIHTPTEGKEAIAIALSFLMKEGVLSQVDEIKIFSLSQIQEIAKVSGFLLKPHAPELISVLLESLSALESSTVKYLSFHTESFGMKQDELDEIRVSASNGSPVSDTLDYAIKQIDDTNVEEMMSKVMDIVRTGVGLPTRVGVGKFVVKIVFELIFSNHYLVHSTNINLSITCLTFWKYCSPPFVV